MSAGSPIISRYGSNDGDIYAIRIQPETESLTIGTTANAPPAGAVDQPVTAYATFNRKRFGVNARQIRFRFSDDTNFPVGYEFGSPISYPALTLTIFGVANVRGATGTVTLGGVAYPIAVIGVTGEAIN